MCRQERERGVNHTVAFTYGVDSVSAESTVGVAGAVRDAFRQVRANNNNKNVVAVVFCRAVVVLSGQS